MLEYERLLRAAEHVGADIPFDVGHYWEDVLLVVLVKRLRRDGRTQAAWAARSRLRSEGIRDVVDMSFEGRIETSGKGNHGAVTWDDGRVAGDHLR